MKKLKLDFSQKLDPFTKNRIEKEILDKLYSTDKEKIHLEMAREFGERWGWATRQGIHPEISFEACKRNFKEVGEAMILISETVTFDLVRPDKKTNDESES